MTTKSMRAVLLDLDGTLLISNEAHARAFVMAAEEIGLEHPGVAEVLTRVGMGSDKMLPEAFGIEKSSEKGRELEEHKDRIFRNQYAPDLKPAQGSRQLLKRFKEDGYRLVIATSAGAEDLKLLLELSGVSDLIDGCTSASDVEDSKPDPDIVEAALKVADVSAGNAIMLGDTPYDIEAATRAGVRIVAVRTGGWSTDALQGAAGVYADPAAILAEYEQTVFAT